MLSYEEALARILNAVPGPLSREEIALEDVLGRTLAEDIFSDVDLPPFDNSAVDGYAMCQPIQRPEFLPVFEVAAGTVPPPLPLGKAAYVATGAVIPEGADRVVMIEDTSIGDFGVVYIKDSGKPGDHIRRRGSDVARGSLALQGGQTLNAGEIGLLAAINRTTVPCVRAPYVGLLTSGDELIPTGKHALQLGQIRDANGPALSAAITQAGGVVTGRRHALDTRESVKEALTSLEGCDVIISSGGVSVGARDYIKIVVEEIGELDFWRIAIRPGKPLAFGKIGNALFFGLPGNPVSSLVTFELFVRPVLRKLAGHTTVTRPQVEAILTAPLSHEPGRREFARAHLEWKNGAYHATPTGAQGSHRLSSLLGADALLVASEDRGDYIAGERLPALLLNG